MTKFFTLARIQQAIEHLQQFESKWVIVPLVFAVNGVNDVDETNIASAGKAGSQNFLNQYFSGSLIGLSAFDNGNNSLRPRFEDTYRVMVAEGRGEDYVTHQKVNLWGSNYSSRGYREMKLAGQIEQTKTRFKLTEAFWSAWRNKLPDDFHFEELLVWLYAFQGIDDSINSWQELFIDFQERHLGKGGRFPRGYEARFNVKNAVPWPDQFDLSKPSNAAYQRALIPSKFILKPEGIRMGGKPKLVIETDVEPLDSLIEDDDTRLIQVKELLEDGYAGVIFVGPPGTSKSWYAEQIAAKLGGLDSKRVRFIQFHSSYQYEDFVEGYVPKDEGGFRLIGKHLIKMCETAEGAKGKLCVLVIDELSRSDPGRVFGEALTYIEMTKRGKKFHLASGKEFSIPSNLVFLATMNPLDRGVDEVDAALERRFAKIAMDPDPAKLSELLGDSGMEPGLISRVRTFFERLLKNKNAQSRLGHAFFRSVKDEDGLRRLWDHQLRFHFEKAFQLSNEGFDDVRRDWDRIFQGQTSVPNESPTE